MKSMYLRKIVFLAFLASPRACLSPRTSRWSTSGCSSPWRSPSLRWSFIPPMRCLSVPAHSILFLNLEWMYWRWSLRRKRWQRRTTAWSWPRWPVHWAAWCCPSAPWSSSSPSGLKGSSSLTPLLMFKIQICLTVLQSILSEGLVICHSTLFLTVYTSGLLILILCFATLAGVQSKFIMSYSHQLRNGNLETQ